MHCVQFSIPYKSCLVGHTSSFILGFFTKRVSFFLRSITWKVENFCAAWQFCHTIEIVYSLLFRYILQICLQIPQPFICVVVIFLPLEVFSHIPAWPFGRRNSQKKKAPMKIQNRQQTWYFLKRDTRNSGSRGHLSR